MLGISSVLALRTVAHAHKRGGGGVGPSGAREFYVEADVRDTGPEALAFPPLQSTLLTGPMLQFLSLSADG
jgi:hypothetical protein